MPEFATVAAALRWAREHGVARLDAQGLLAHAASRDRAWVLAHDDAALDTTVGAVAAALLMRRAAGEPYAYLVGQREFRGLTLRVTPDVLIPRPDTETVVDWALEVLAGPLAAHAAPRVLDLGTGSGAIALAVKAACPRAQVTGSDASAAALAVADDNANRLGLAVHWCLSRWWDALPVQAEPWNLVLANPPYVAAGDAHLAALAHEPLVALVPADDNGDGLADLRRIIQGASRRMSAGAWLLLEHGADQSAAVRALLAAAGLVDTATRRDLAGLDRASGARRQQT